MLRHHTTFAAGFAAAVALTVPRPTHAQAITPSEEMPDHEVVVSGFAGPTFGENVEDSDAAFGGSLTYLYEGFVGGEFVAGFRPDFDSVTPMTDDVTLNNYMANAVAAVPLGIDGRWRPYVSGGVGYLTINRNDDPDADLADIDDAFEADDSQLGGNLGAGLMAFTDRWGVRTGVTYLTGFEDNSEGDELDQSDVLNPDDLLSDTSFWQFDLGVAYRW